MFNESAALDRSRFSEAVTVPLEELETDPHGVFRRYRSVTPLVKREDDIYIAIRATDVEALVSDPRTRQTETEFVRSRGVSEGPLFDFFRHSMLFRNGLDHRRLRAPLSRAFAYKLVTEMRPQIRAIANRLIDRAYARGEMELLDDYASWIPARVISTILGVPEDDIPEFTRHVYSLARAVGSGFTSELAPELQAAAGHLTRYVDDLLNERRARPQDDFLTSYIKVMDESEKLSHIETLTQIVLLLLAGSDTTRAAITIQTSLLLQHREQWDAVRQDAALIPGAVSESLRFEPSVGSFPRFTLEDIKIDGVLLPRNHVVSLSTLSAMRDPALYSDPDTFNIRRTDHPRKHMIFGGGVHRCLGEVLAKVELEEALAAIVTRLPQLQLAGVPPIVSGNGGIRRVSSMPVRWPL